VLRLKLEPQQAEVIAPSGMPAATCSNLAPTSSGSTTSLWPGAAPARPPVFKSCSRARHPCNQMAAPGAGQEFL